MLGKLVERLRAATNPFQGFLGEVWSIWARDAGRAVLIARWQWDRLPPGLAQQAAAIQQQARTSAESRAIDEQVRTSLGSIGIFPGYGGGGGTSFGFGMNPDHALFIAYMGEIQANRGDPPASREMALLAESVLRGQRDPVEALLAASPAFNRAQIGFAAQMLNAMGMSQLLRLQAVVAVAFALPRERIPILLPEVERT